MKGAKNGFYKLSGTPYIRFFGDDWLSGTQDLDLIERGALITIVALTASTGQPPKEDYKRLGRRFGCTPMKAKKSVLALIELGKLHIVDGAIINGRALKEVGISQKLSEKQTENANARWSKKTEKGNEYSTVDHATAMPPHMPKTCQPEPEPEPDKERESKDSCVLVLIDADESDTSFSEFWTHYPRKIGKAAAAKAFAKAAKKHNTDDILFGLSQQIEAMKSKEQQFIPHAATWLNAERWTDEPEQPNSQHTRANQRDQALADEILAAARAR
jgi:hypothetical protein